MKQRSRTQDAQGDLRILTMAARLGSSRASESTLTVHNWRPEKAKSRHLGKSWLRPVRADSKLASVSRGFASQRQENVVFSPNWPAEFEPKEFFIFCVPQLIRRCAANGLAAHNNPLFFFALALPNSERESDRLERKPLAGKFFRTKDSPVSNTFVGEDTRAANQTNLPPWLCLCTRKPLTSSKSIWR